MGASTTTHGITALAWAQARSFSSIRSQSDVVLMTASGPAVSISAVGSSCAAPPCCTGHRAPCATSINTLIAMTPIHFATTGYSSIAGQGCYVRSDISDAVIAITC